MFSTKSVNSLKNIFASYHEPLPLSKQQSQKLLDGLKVSFRKQLDREYGESSDSLASAPKAVGAEQFMRHSAASRHLKDILNNPLFSYNKEVSPRRLAELSPKVTGHPRDPMEVFDHAVARGMMTAKAATGCMAAKLKELNGFEAPGSMDASQTASRVVQWLWSSGAEKDLSFLDEPTFVRVLTRFLVPEGMEEVAWEWLKRVLNDPSGTLDREKQLKRSSHLLAELVRTKCQYQYGNLDSAISTMLQAQKMFQSSPLLSELLVLSWRSVSWFSTVEALHRTAPSEELFEAHLATADRLPQPFLMERAHLHLHHPTHPDHLPALEFFADEKTLGNTLHRFYGSKMKLKFKLPPNRRLGVVQWMCSLGKDTVKYLSESGRTQEAQGVTNILEAQVAGLINSAREPVG